jgi:predicted transcriptional regulator
MFPVTDEGRLLGCVTTPDVQQVPQNQWEQRTIGEILKQCANENTTARSADAMQTLSRMNQGSVSRLMVVQHDHLEGIVSLKDLLKFIALKVELEEGHSDAPRW